MTRNRTVLLYVESQTRESPCETGGLTDDRPVASRRKGCGAGQPGVGRCKRYTRDGRHKALPQGTGDCSQYPGLNHHGKERGSLAHKGTPLCMQLTCKGRSGQPRDALEEDVDPGRRRHLLDAHDVVLGEQRDVGACHGPDHGP